MKIVALNLTAFRCFQEKIIMFHPNLTVFVSENGGGKTAVLEAINFLLSRMATGLIQRDGKAMTANDIPVSQDQQSADKAQISLSLFLPTRAATMLVAIKAKDKSVKKVYPQFEYDAELGIPSQSPQDVAKLKQNFNEYINGLLEAERNGNPYSLPLVRYYGTNRVFMAEVERRTDFRKQFRRFEAFEGAFGASSNFRAIYERFDYLERLEHEAQRERRDFSYELPDLKVMREAVSVMLPEFSNPRTKLKPLQFVIDQTLENGEIKTLRLGQLSDGFRTMLALAMDLSLRMAQANPFDQTGINPLHQQAIVIVDEIDLHLHPSWQQRILEDLRRTFPNTQFIVSTHSPQVLSTVPAECIRIIENGQIFTPTGTEGAESNRILKRIFGVDPRPQNNAATKELSEYLQLVYSNQWESERASTLRQILNTRYSNEEPALLEADLYIENQKWEKANQ